MCNRHQFLKALIGTLSCSAFIIVPFASAQQARPVASADIPFAFQVAGKVLPAGHYKLSLQAPSLLSIQGVGGDAFLMVREDDPKPHANSALTFSHENGYELRELWAAGQNKHLVSTAKRPRPLPLVVSAPPAATTSATVSLMEMPH
jgi:hypothetical protein